MGLNTMESDEKKSILLTFDIEDWFQVENFKQYIKFSTWNCFESRVEANTAKILDLLDSYPSKPRATFFVLGWVAQKFPDIVKEIAIRGHEVASHGFDHHLCHNLKTSALIDDLKKSKDYLSEIIGTDIYGYRAPSFAINDSILKKIQEAGYLYDSSYNSFSAHGRYGTIELNNAQKKNAVYKFNNSFYEIPVSNINILNKVFPLGGGGYFRLLPLTIFKLGMRSVLSSDNAFVFYSHPWEFDPEQPRVKQASKSFKFRHYVNLNKTENKLRGLIESFLNCQFITCNQYLMQNS